jgi:hypothetical protein
MSEFQAVSEFRRGYVRVQQNVRVAEVEGVALAVAIRDEIVDGAAPVVPVDYGIAGELAVFEGDIILGTAAELANTTAESPLERMALPDVPRPNMEEAVAIVGIGFRWPGNVIPFVIDPALPSPARVTDAIDHWESHTLIRFVSRTVEANFVRFQPGDGCSSHVGRQGGEQAVILGPECSTGNAIHEIGHTVGLWHEQSRSDRNTFIRINFANIVAGFEPNFNQHLSDGVDLGTYDFGSIMHYPPKAFSRNGQPTIEALSGSPTFGQRSALSAGDIAGVTALTTP